MEQPQLKKKVDMLRQENKKSLEDGVLLKQHLGDLKVLCNTSMKRPAASRSSTNSVQPYTCAHPPPAQSGQLLTSVPGSP